MSNIEANLDDGAGGSVKRDDSTADSVKCEEVTGDPLDPGSSTFQPLQAIYSSEYHTDQGTVALDNVEKCIAFIQGRVRQNKPKVEKAKEQKKELEEVKLERQFLPSQLPQKGRGRKVFRHAMTRMSEFTSGPLSVLRRCLEEGVRVKVWTRGVDRVRGVATGFIAAFDKHWNLALTDVEEQFTRRRSRKVPVGGGVGTEVGKGSEWRVGESVFRVVQVKRKVEVCVRHVPQVLLRGEHVVMVGQMGGQLDIPPDTGVPMKISSKD